MAIRFYNEEIQHDAMIAKLQGFWITVNTTKDARESTIKKICEKTTVIDRHIIIEVGYNTSKDTYYIDNDQLGVALIPPNGVIYTHISPSTEEEEYGHIVLGHYIPLAIHLEGKQYQRIRSRKLQQWIKQAKCIMPTVVAEHE